MTTRDQNALIAYRVGPGIEMKLIAAPARRQWMDQTDRAFANRCLPMLIANQSGWLVLNDRPVVATWLGETGLDSVIVETSGEPPFAAASHFGHGILTFSLPFLFRTSPGTSLWFRGPVNMPKDAIAPLEGIVETDWSTATATMNWKFVRPHTRVEFDQDEPICMIVPQQIDLLEAALPRLSELSENNELDARFRSWCESRGAFNAALERRDPDAVAESWQRHYFRGTAPGIEGTLETATVHHRTRLSLREFK